MRGADMLKVAVPTIIAACSSGIPDNQRMDYERRADYTNRAFLAALQPILEQQNSDGVNNAPVYEKFPVTPNGVGPDGKPFLVKCVNGNRADGAVNTRNAVRKAISEFLVFQCVMITASKGASLAESESICESASGIMADRVVDDVLAGKSSIFSLLSHGEGVAGDASVACASVEMKL